MFIPSQVAPWVASAETDRLCMWRPSVSSAAAVVFMTSASACLNFLFAVSKTFLKTAKVDLNRDFSKQEFLILIVCNCYLKQERIKCMNYFISLDKKSSALSTRQVIIKQNLSVISRVEPKFLTVPFSVRGLAIFLW